MLKKEVVKQHIDSLDNCEYIVAVAYDEKAINELYAIVSELDNTIKKYKLLLGDGHESVAILDLIDKCNVNNSLIFLCDFDQSKVMLAHSKLGLFKDRGYIVTSCFARNLFYEYPKDLSGITYQGIFDRTSKFVDGLGGDYLEFGVFDGRTMSLAYHCMKKQETMQFYAFDTFAGIVGKTEGESVAYSDGCYYSNLQTFIHNMKAANVNVNRVKPIVGNILETTKAEDLKTRIKRAAVVHIDCDVYVAAKAALDFCTSLLCQGSIILFDEFHANHADDTLGERRALKEWLAENPGITVERWHDYATVARAFIVHKR